MVLATFAKNQVYACRTKKMQSNNSRENSNAKYSNRRCNNLGVQGSRLTSNNRRLNNYNNNRRANISNNNNRQPNNNNDNYNNNKKNN